MRSIQEFFFGWVGRDGTVCVLNAFIFATEKSITFQKKKISYYFPLRQRQKKITLSEITQILWSIV